MKVVGKTLNEHVVASWRLSATISIITAMIVVLRLISDYPSRIQSRLVLPAVRLAAAGRVNESLLLFRKAFAMDKNWAILVLRLPQVGRLPKDKTLIERILAKAPQKWELSTLPRLPSSSGWSFSQGRGASI